MRPLFDFPKFVITVLIVSIWVIVSEIFRYFVIVMPETRSFLSMVPNIAPMTLAVFLVWCAWVALLTAMFVFMFWLVAQVFGNNFRSVVIAGIASWAFSFVLFWVGMCNMSLAQPRLALIALPLALLETVAASYIASLLYRRHPNPNAQSR